MTLPEKISPPELRELSLAKERQEVFTESSDKRLILMRQLFDNLSPDTPLRILRISQDDKKDVVLRDSSFRGMNYLGSDDTLTLVPEKNITGNKNGYSYIHRTVETNGIKMNKIYVKVKTSTGQIGYVALEHIGKAEAKVNWTPTTTAPEAKLDRAPTIPAPKTETTPAPIPETNQAPAQKIEKEGVNAITKVTSLPSGLLVARGPNQSTHPLISQKNMVDMIITYEWPGGERQSDTWNTYDIGWGINTGGPELERRYAFGENYSQWNSGFIPVNEVKGAVEKTLEARIARTYESCKKREIDFDALPLFAQKVLVDLHYNMNSIQNSFPKFWEAIKTKNWKEAGKQLMDSGKGYPNSYLTDVYTRAYANAMMLSKEDTNGAEKYKNEATNILNWTHNAYLLYEAYFEENGIHGKHLNRRDQWKILKETPDPVQFVDALLSDDILRADTASTKTIQSLIKKHLKENPDNREVLISELEKRLGGFTWPLDTGEKIASYQIHAYLTNPEKFKTDIKFIDGEYGEKTAKAYLGDIFIAGNWKEKIEGTDGILKKTPEDIQKYLSTLWDFEKTVLAEHYKSSLNVSHTSSPEAIKNAQLALVLLGKNITIDGRWTEKLRELLWYSEKAKKLAKYVQDNYGRFKSGVNSCWASVGKMLTGFGIPWLPDSDRDGENWNEILDARTPEQFIKVPIHDPSEARGGGILCYEDGGTIWGAAIWHGHVEVKWEDGAYYHYLRRVQFGGSRWEDIKNNHFTGYVYYPRDLA